MSDACSNFADDANLTRRLLQAGSRVVFDNGYERTTAICARPEPAFEDRAFLGLVGAVGVPRRVLSRNNFHFEIFYFEISVLRSDRFKLVRSAKFNPKIEAGRMRNVTAALPASWRIMQEHQGNKGALDAQLVDPSPGASARSHGTSVQPDARASRSSQNTCQVCPGDGAAGIILFDTDASAIPDGNMRPAAAVCPNIQCVVSLGLRMGK